MNAHPSSPHYYPWIIYDAPDRRLHGRVYRGADLENFSPGFFPDGTVFRHRNKGTLRLIWNGVFIGIQSLDDPVPREGKGKALWPNN